MKTKYRLKKLNRREAIIYFGSAFLGFMVATLVTTSSVIGIPFGLITTTIPVVIIKKRAENAKNSLRALWPEILDHIISGLQSGLSLAETLVALESRGPLKSRAIFHVFSENLRSGKDFGAALQLLKEYFNDSVADQVCEVLDFSRLSGGRDTSLTLRTLSNFIRRDLALRAEIQAKHSWVKNSAALAAISPWILLLMLASQPNTLQAYTSRAGFMILIAGALLTVTAYFWMEKVGKLNDSPRIFA